MLSPPWFSISTRSPASLTAVRPFNGIDTTCAASTRSPEAGALPLMADGASNVNGRGSTGCIQTSSAILS